MDLGRVVWLPLGLALSLGCHQRAYMPPGPADSGISDAAGDLFAPLTLDIAVTGCPSFDIAQVVCNGPAPLTVSFAPVGTPALTTFLWTFGDGSPSSSERAPSHTYALPGKYDVGVTGQGSTVGSLSQLRHELISVQSLTTGAACDVESQCGDGLHCLCSSGSGCGAAFSRGICSTACETAFCGAGAVCAAFTLGRPTGGDAAVISDAGSPPTCLADCSGGAACAPGFVCQQLPGGGGASAWVHACLPLGAANDFGASCRNANGSLDGAACTTGYCANLGALGVCTAACDGAHPCPADAACVHLAAANVCLPACSATAPCTGDPSLGCTAATLLDAGPASGGLTITAGDPGLTYCAPR